MSGHAAWRAVGTVIYTGDGGFDIRDVPNAGERAVLICSAVNSHAELVKALEEIAKGQGAFSRDPLTHASNTIDDMKAIANAALATLTARKVG